MKLKSSPKIFNNYKCDFPENTIDRIKDAFKKLGLELQYKQKIIQSAGYSVYSGDLLLENFGFLTTGKGISPILSEAGAYAEMAERFSAGFTIFYNLNSNIEEYGELLKDIIERKFLRGFTIDNNSSLIDFAKINQYFQKKISLQQYNLLKDQGIFDILVDGYSLVNENYTKIPIHFIDAISGSNGLAAGNTMEEAIVQGSCEIFERFAAHKIVSQKIVCPTIDINSIKDDRIQNYVKMLDSINIEVIIKDFTLNDTVPVIGVLFINRNIKNDKNPLKITQYYKMIDVGSHLNLKEAVIRCFVERLQELTKEELMYRKESDELYDFWTKKLNKKYIKIKDVFKHFFRMYYYYGDLSFLEKGSLISFDELTSIINYDSLDDVRYIIDICKRNNWDLQIVDCTHKVLNFPAVRAIIPPLSTDSNPYVSKLMKFDNLEEQFNYFYGIKDFYNYVYTSDWLVDESQIKTLIHNIEDALAEDLYSFEFYLRRGPFYQCVNLFHILAFANLSVKNHEESSKYFEFLMNLQSNKSLKSNYFNYLFNPDYDPTLYTTKLNQIKKEQSTFAFASNPFQLKKDSVPPDKKISSLFKKINESYF